MIFISLILLFVVVGFTDAFVNANSHFYGDIVSMNDMASGNKTLCNQFNKNW